LNPDGYASGKVTLQVKGIMPAEDMLRFHPELQERLDEIVRLGWNYLYIEASGTALKEVDGDMMPYVWAVDPTSTDAEGTRPHTLITIDAGERPLKVTGVPLVESFRINISTKHFPRAATLELSKGVVTFLHDPFWRWEKGWEADEKKRSDAIEVYEVSKWLLDVKGLKLREPFTIERYKALQAAVEDLRK
jgi:hypothetical protein